MKLINILSDCSRKINYVIEITIEIEKPSMVRNFCLYVLNEPKKEKNPTNCMVFVYV